MKKLLPKGKRILLRREVIKKVGSIIVPEKSEEMKLCFAEVMAMGPDIISETKIGDFVYFGRYASQILNAKEAALYGIDVEPEKEELMILNDDDVLGYVVEEGYHA